MTFRPCLCSWAWVALLVTAGCVDTSPLTYVAPDRPGRDAGLPGDGSLEGGPGHACRECLSAENGPCTTAYTACVNDAKCRPPFECIFRLGCFAFAEIQDKLACGAPCIEEYNLNSASDPTVEKLIPINGCTAGPCLTACVGH